MLLTALLKGFGVCWRLALGDPVTDCRPAATRSTFACPGLLQQCFGRGPSLCQGPLPGIRYGCGGLGMGCVGGERRIVRYRPLERREMGGPTSNGSVGGGFNNAMTESLFATLECVTAKATPGAARNAHRPAPTVPGASRSGEPEVKNYPPVVPYPPGMERTLRAPAIVYFGGGRQP